MKKDDDEIITPGMSDREILIRRRVHRLADFYRHAVVFVIINILIWIVVYFSSRWFAWFAFWTTVSWGVGLLIQGLAVLPFWNFLSPEWEDRKVREMMERDKS